MPVLIVPTKGANDSNSYATIAESDIYFDNLFGHDDWVEIDGADKKRLLLSATKNIEAMSVSSGKLTSTQALKFPVSGTDDGFAQAKEACILQAYHLFLNFAAIEEQVSNGISKANFNGVKRLSPDVYRLLAGFIDKELPFTMKIRRG